MCAQARTALFIAGAHVQLGNYGLRISQRCIGFESGRLHIYEVLPFFSFSLLVVIAVVVVVVDGS